MAPNNVDIQIGKAWAAHRQGNNKDAVAEFEQIVRSDAENVDAYFGLGLSQRANGQLAEAKIAFEKALELAKNKLAEIRGVNKDENNLETVEDDRYMMLVRMLSQRLDELKPKLNV